MIVREQLQLSFTMAAAPETYPLKVAYCPSCTLPADYCRALPACLPWLKTQLPPTPEPTAPVAAPAPAPTPEDGVASSLSALSLATPGEGGEGAAPAAPPAGAPAEPGGEEASGESGEEGGGEKKKKTSACCRAVESVSQWSASQCPPPHAPHPLPPPSQSAAGRCSPAAPRPRRNRRGAWWCR